METKQEKSGWQKYLLVLIPVGLFLCGIMVCVAFVFSIVYGVFGLIRSSEVYQQALTEAQADAKVTEALGEPIEPGWWVSGSIETTGPSGRADISFPISGPENSGTIYAVATKSAGKWQFSLLQVEIEGQSERLNLLKE